MYRPTYVFCRLIYSMCRPMWTIFKSSMLIKCNVGCYFGGLLRGLIVNHMMYADDLVLLSPSVAGLSKLLKICERFGDGHYVQYNPKESAVMTFRASYLKGVNIPIFKYT